MQGEELVRLLHEDSLCGFADLEREDAEPLVAFGGNVERDGSLAAAASGEGRREAVRATARIPGSSNRRS